MTVPALLILSNVGLPSIVTSVATVHGVSAAPLAPPVAPGSAPGVARRQGEGRDGQSGESADDPILLQHVILLFRIHLSLTAPVRGADLFVSA